MEKLMPLRRKLMAAGLAMSGAVALAGCSSGPVDYEGTGNEFVVRGVVSDSESDGLVQLKDGKNLVVIKGAGKAATWFEDNKGHHFLTHEFDFLQRYSKETDNIFDGCGKDVYVGEVYDEQGEHIRPQDLRPGETVEIEGKIRESRYRYSSGKTSHCGEQDLAVYDTVRVVDDPSQPDR